MSLAKLVPVVSYIIFHQSFPPSLLTIQMFVSSFLGNSLPLSLVTAQIPE